MVKVIVGNNLTKNTVIVDEERTLKSVLEENEIDYTRGTMNLDGCSLQPGDLDKTFEEMGVKEKCFLLNVVKMDNAA